jgi:type I restriction enzyme S subunit
MRDLMNGTRDWPVVAAGDVIRNVADSCDPVRAGIDRYVGLDHLDGEDLRVRRWGNVSEGTTFTRRFEAGDVLFAKRRAYQRKTAIADFAGVCSGDLLVLRASDGALSPDLVAMVVSMDGFVQHAIATSAGSLSPRTKWKDLAHFRFRLPPSDVQDKLTDLFAGAQGYADACTSAADAATTWGNAAFEQSLSDSRSDRVVQLQDVLVEPPQSGCSAPESPRPTGHFVLGLQAITQNGYVGGQFKDVEPTEDMLRAKVQLGDVLVSRSNTLDRVGFAAICLEDRTDLSFPDTMMRLRPDESQVLPEFLVRALMSTAGRRYITRVAAGTSASMKKINRRTLGAFEMKLPPVQEQQSCLVDYQRAESLAASLRTSAARAIAVLSALRTRAFGI